MASTSDLVRVRDCYFTPADAELLLDSAVALLQHLRTLDGVLPQHLKEQVSVALWKLTEAPGQPPNAKYNVRFCSQGVVQAKDAGIGVPVNHEHVHTRKEIVAHVLGSKLTDDDLASYVRQRSEACIVTRTEHAHLGQSKKSGWLRYVEAGIGVFDRAQQSFVDPAALAAGQITTQDTALPEPSGPPPIELEDPLELLPGPAAQHLRDLVGLIGELGAVAVRPSRGAPTYVLVHDTEIEEPTAAIAYLNFSGKVDVRLDWDDVPERIRQLPGVGRRANERYPVTCKVTDPESLSAAERLINLALNKFRRTHWG